LIFLVWQACAALPERGCMLLEASIYSGAKVRWGQV